MSDTEENNQQCKRIDEIVTKCNQFNLKKAAPYNQLKKILKKSTKGNRPKWNDTEEKNKM
jgi:hypothetical protein